jgi:hypothetical protein
MNLPRIVPTTCVFALICISGYAQPKILTDTLVKHCTVSVGKTYLITDQRDLENSQFYDSDNLTCIPFQKIDFEKHQLVGYVYRGSNCDRALIRSRLRKTDRSYTIQFVIDTPGACRDNRPQLVWFVVEKPPNEETIYFERIPIKTFLETK